MSHATALTGDAPVDGAGRIAILAAGLEAGGAERVTLNLAEYFVSCGRPVDLVLVRGSGPLLKEVHPGVRIVDLGARRALTAITPFRRYLRRDRPIAVVSINFDVNITAAVASLGLRNKPKLILTVHAAPSPVLARESRLRRLITTASARTLYPTADWVVAVSAGAADDLKVLGWGRKPRVITIYNPVVRSDFDAAADAPADHPWLEDRSAPVILGVGRLVAQKDFDLLIRAFAIVRRSRPAKLLIIGEGEERGALERRIEQLGLSGEASLLGFRANPYPFMRAADLFVLSSAFEGFGNVIVEAMAAGTAVVATDCPSGPAEILGGGEWGPLVPTGDADTMADAIRATLDRPLSGEGLRQRAAHFTLERTASKYLELIDG